MSKQVSSCICNVIDKQSKLVRRPYIIYDISSPGQAFWTACNLVKDICKTPHSCRALVGWASSTCSCPLQGLSLLLQACNAVSGEVLQGQSIAELLHNSMRLGEFLVSSVAAGGHKAPLRAQSRVILQQAAGKHCLTCALFRKTASAALIHLSSAASLLWDMLVAPDAERVLQLWHAAHMTGR